MTWRAGRGTVSEQDYNSVVLIEKLHVRATHGIRVVACVR